MEPTKPVPAVYAAIVAVMATLTAEGITKNRKNQQQGFSFRGIDDVLNTLNPILAKNNLVMLPRVLDRHQEERTTAKGGALFYTFVKVEYDLVCAIDGSLHTVCAYGEAMDSGDKSTNKAMSAAFKYAAFQAFCIPTEGDNDADSTTHEPLAKKPAAPAGAPVTPTVQMATEDQKMDIAHFHLDERTKAKVDEALAFYEKEHGVNKTTLAGLTFKMAEILIKKCEDAKKAASGSATPPATPAAKGGKK